MGYSAGGELKGSWHMEQSEGAFAGSGVDVNIRIKRFTDGSLGVGISSSVLWVLLQSC